MSHTRYCHNSDCDQFNQPQEYRYTPDTWDAPGEWIDDPDCRECNADLSENEQATE